MIATLSMISIFIVRNRGCNVH